MRQLIFWEPTVSPHKLALIRALASRLGADSVRYVADVGLLEGRAKQGWNLGSLDDIDLVLSPDPWQVAAIFDATPADAVHIISGLRRIPMLVTALKEAGRRRARYGILSEPRVSEGAGGWFRWGESWLTEGAIRRTADFVLAIGRNGPPWFRFSGYAARRIYPFAYFVPDIVAGPHGGSDTIRIGYLGRLTKPKGIDLFLDAFTRLPDRFSASIAGTGQEVDAVTQAALAHGRRLSFSGTIPMADVGGFLSSLDLLVAPSVTTSDGWGAVVSEALMAGTAVVATHRVGASICLDAPWRGEVVSTLTAAALANAIQRAAEQENIAEPARNRRRAWACAHLSAVAGADHLLAILRHIYEGSPRPKPFFASDDVAMERPA